MDIQVTPMISWHPTSDLSSDPFHVTGTMPDATAVSVVTHNDRALSVGERSTAIHEWLHQGLYTLPRPVDGDITIVALGDHLSEPLIREALRRWLRTRSRAA